MLDGGNIRTTNLAINKRDVPGGLVVNSGQVTRGHQPWWELTSTPAWSHIPRTSGQGLAVIYARKYINIFNFFFLIFQTIHCYVCQ